MNINFWLNGVNRHAEISPDTLLIDFLRKKGSTLAARIEGKKIVTLEGMQREAQEFGSFLANEGAEQCGFCNPGFIMNVFAMLNEIKDPTEEQIKEYLAGNLCRCSGFVSQTRSILKFLKYKKAQEEA